MYVGLLVWVGIASLLSYVIERLWTDFTRFSWFRYALAPGVIVHELSHLAACFATGARVRHVVLFGPEGGSVTHGRPKMPLVGQPVISLAPVAGCTLALWVVWRLFAARLDLASADLPALHLTASSGFAVWNLLKGAFLGSLHQVYDRKFLSLEGLAFLYLVVTFSICMAPSRTDLRHALTGLAVVGAIVFLLQQFGFDNWQLAAEYSQQIIRFGWRIFTFSILLLMSALAVSIPAALLFKIFGKSS